MQFILKKVKRKFYSPTKDSQTPTEDTYALSQEVIDQDIGLHKFSSIDPKILSSLLNDEYIGNNFILDTQPISIDTSLVKLTHLEKIAPPIKPTPHVKSTPPSQVVLKPSLV